jgi:SH3-like domain-containing protein
VGLIVGAVRAVFRFSFLAGILSVVIVGGCMLATVATSAVSLAPPIRAAQTTNVAPGPVTYRVANTDGQGVYIRRTPRLSDQIRAWQEGTPMVEVGASLEGDNIVWRQVRDPDGNKGWIPAHFLVAQPR